VFVGYAAAGTLGRRIIDGAKQVSLFGEDVNVRAHIHMINGFSAHADQRELLAWRRAIGGVETTFLVHGEVPTMQQLAAQMPQTKVELPSLHQAFDL
jgi:metallo-beta-lactamase family protein